MKENKNIERLFQEKFKDFEAIPPHNSWEIIAGRLKEKKKKKRVIPFWFQFSEIAASLFIIGALIWNFSKSSHTTEISAPKNQTVNRNNETRKLLKKESIVEEVQKTKENQQKQSLNSDKDKLESVIVSNEKYKKTRTTESKVGENSKNKNIQKSKITHEENLISDAVKIKVKSKSDKINNPIANQTRKKYVFKNDDLLNNSGDRKKSEIIFKNKSFNETLISKNDEHTKKHNFISNDIEIQDSTLVADISNETNPLEELLKEKEEGKNADEKGRRNKWAISTNASPVYFNSIAQGSSLDSQFNLNDKSYATTFSVGITGIYSLTEKLSLRSGINTIVLRHNTNDVFFDARISDVSQNIPTISRNATGSNMLFTSKTDVPISLSGDVENVSISNNLGSLEQNISYVEVPLELSYKLLDKKFGIEVIGGMSTLFLNQNNISLIANGVEMEIGRANNLNDIHFSSNVGLGFRYSFWKSFDANFQPMFKYQIKTLSENFGNFKPYFIGLYTGVSFSF